MGKEFLKFIEVGFMHGVEEPWCNNKGVAILPFVFKNNKYHYLLVKENNPLFKENPISEYGTITGGLENNDPAATVIHEMQEEAGIDVSNLKASIYFLGTHYANKSSTKLWHFYGIDLTSLNLDLNKTYAGKGDGSIAEQTISAQFISEEKLNTCNDALSLVTYGKLTILSNTIIEKIKEIVEKEKLEELVEENLAAVTILTEQEWKEISENGQWLDALGDWNQSLDDTLKRVEKCQPLVQGNSNEFSHIAKMIINQFKRDNIVTEGDKTYISL